jgi:outer membrane protein TolC
MAVTLDSLVAQALRNNPGIRSADARSGGARARIDQAGAWDDPQVGIEFYATPVTSLNPIRDGKETDYFIQQTIPFPGKKSLGSDIAVAGVEFAGHDADALRRNIIAEVKKTYAMIYSLQRELDVNAENRQLLQQIAQSVQTKYSVAQATLGDALKAETELAKLSNDSTSLIQQLESAEAMMNALRAAPDTAEIGRVADIVPAYPGVSLDSLLDYALDSRPDLMAMESMVQMSRADLAASERDRLPDFMVRGAYKAMAGTTDDWALMVGVNVPLAPWSSGKYEGKIEEDEYAVEANLQAHHQMLNMIRYEVRAAWTKVQSHWEQIRRYKETIIPQAEQTVQTTLSSYQANKTDFLSLLDSERMLNMFKMDYYMLVGDYERDRAALEQAVGTDIH